MHDVRFALSIGALLALAALTACGEEAEPEPAATHDGHTASSSLCASFGEEVDSYDDGMRKTGEGQVELMIADPGPPDLGDNVWTLRVLDMQGQPVDATGVTIAPFMPGHGHGTNPPSFVAEPQEEAGTWAAGPFDLFMPGVWEFTVTVESEGVEPWSTLFRFCIEG